MFLCIFKSIYTKDFFSF
uniref:Uncharacterized protein n=1 Tax=Lepeophtheirus salmonis TaxID=72036 RepID=A0A0K2V0Q9_LEPSM